MDGPTRLKDWRTQTRRLSQQDAADLVGVHQNTWSDWESGKKVPRAEMALRLHVVTEGECPIESWASDARLVRQYRAALRATGTDD